ncbi:hypothetical protein CRG98_020687 [Punica granatum]|nr:hypothetical protein CRG98_020687 [Punica granatum]
MRKVLEIIVSKTSMAVEEMYLVRNKAPNHKVGHHSHVNISSGQWLQISCTLPSLMEASSFSSEDSTRKLLHIIIITMIIAVVPIGEESLISSAAPLQLQRKQRTYEEQLSTERQD